MTQTKALNSSSCLFATGPAGFHVDNSPWEQAAPNTSNNGVRVRSLTNQDFLELVGKTVGPAILKAGSGRDLLDVPRGRNPID